MADSPQPTLFVLAGPNGAGKSTLYHDRIRPITRAPFINADEIAREWKLRGKNVDGYAASREAALQRQQLIEKRQSFVTETVFSHPSKLALLESALGAGYRVVLYHINVRHPDMAVARVNARVAIGGHSVPKQKIVERYKRNQPLIRQAANLTSAAMVFDNSRRGHPPRWLLTLRQGRIAGKTDGEIPAWAVELYF